MTHTLQVGIEAALGLDVGMADKIADLGLFAAEIAFFAHDVLRICRKLCVSYMRQSRVTAAAHCAGNEPCIQHGRASSSFTQALPKRQAFFRERVKILCRGLRFGRKTRAEHPAPGGSEPSGARKPACRASSCDSRRAWTRQPMAYGGAATAATVVPRHRHTGGPDPGRRYRKRRGHPAVPAHSRPRGPFQGGHDVEGATAQGKLGIHGRGAGPGIEPQFLIGHPDDFAVHAAVQGMAVPQALVFSRWQRGAVHRGRVSSMIFQKQKRAGRPAPGWRCDGGYFSRPCRVCLPLLMVWSNSCCRESISSLTETMLLTRATLAPQRRSRAPGCPSWR